MIGTIARWILLLGLAPWPAAAMPQDAAPPPAPSAVPVATLEVVARYPHDSTAFTQGLLWHDGALYESTGEDRSEVRRVSLADGRVLAHTPIPAGQFGEGMALWKSTLISLTWKNGIAHRWWLDSLKPAGSDFRYPGEGWGLTAAPEGLLLSDGTPTLRVLDPERFTERRRIAVTLAGKPLPRLNELEMVGGKLLANVWMSGFIVEIDPATGHVTRVIDARPLVDEVGAKNVDAVLNGIAWDAERQRLFVTGKLWPTLFEVRIVDSAGAAAR
ncbi:glutaminyl-peptide cyclotransferase [Sphingomonas sp. DT-204]|uniref:glutaminyl-peptide cyclotransferase n=1 Tax=Sphingomonas sp. DT-204 TaxID=3396166 RepID=UPI003F1A1457